MTDIKTSCKYCIIPKEKITTDLYYSTISKWREYVEKGNLKFIGGDSSLEMLEVSIKREDKFAYNHYFECNCGNYLRSGFSIRSSVPILEKINQLPENIASETNNQTNSIKENTKLNGIEKLKLGLLGLLISFSIIYPIYRYVMNKSVTENGLKIKSLVVGKERLKNAKSAGYSYFLTLKYKQDDGVIQKTQIGVNKDEYLYCQKGDSVPIIYDINYSKNVKLNLE